jgi:ketosteroid isomerase-like protein
LKRVPLKLKPGQGEERALEERLLMRNPALFRALFSPVLRAPARFPGRRLLLRRALRQALGALNRRDLDAVVARYDPSIEFELDEGPASLPDMDTHYEGIDAARAAIDEFLDAWEDVSWEPYQLVDGGDRFVVLVAITGVGRQGMELREELGVLYTVRRGRVVRQSLHWGWEKTLGLAGLVD